MACLTMLCETLVQVANSFSEVIQLSELLIMSIEEASQVTPSFANVVVGGGEHI